jgi:hypothetical protein
LKPCMIALGGAGLLVCSLCVVRKFAAEDGRSAVFVAEWKGWKCKIVTIK